MVTLVTILHIFVCVFLILVVLLQAGKGGGMGLAFGSSGAQTVFGGSGAGNFLTKLTAGTAVLFMLTSLTLAYFASAKEGAWLVEYEKRMSEQSKRDKAAHEKLLTPPATPAEVNGTKVEGQTDQAPVETKAADEKPATEAAPATEGGSKPPVTPAPAPATPPEPAPEKK